MEFAKSKKKRKPLPGYAIFIIVFGTLSIIVGVIKGVVEAQNEKAMEQVLDIMQSGSKTTSTTSVSSVGITPISYNGVSFKLPKGWTYETSTENDGLIHIVSLESPDVDFSTITWMPITDELTARNWIQTIHDDGGEDYPGYSPGEISDITYCGVSAYNFYFTCKQFGFTYYARCICFTKKGKTFCVINLSDLRSNLTKKFSFFEDTLSI